MRHFPLVALLALALVAPLASAHCAALPRDTDSRLLGDYSDECKVDGGTNDCRGSYELISLDIQERWDGSRTNAVFRFLMDGGAAGPHKDTLTLTGPKGTQNLVMTSADGSRFAASGGFDSVSGPQPVGDGGRFFVEGMVALDKLGAVGESISSIKVQAEAGTSGVGDFMPGGCHNTALPPDCPAPLGNDPCYYSPTTAYKLRGSSYYASLNAASPPELKVNSEQIVQLDIKSLLERSSQMTTLSVTGASGVTARFHDPSAGAGKGYSETLSFGLSAKQSYGAHLALTGLTAGAQGVLTVSLTTDVGGHVTIQVPYQVAGTSSTSSSASSSTASTSAGKSSPGVEVPLLLLTALSAALARRRIQE